MGSWCFSCFHNDLIMAKIIILCAGEGTRWGNHMDLPKQLIAINGESLLHRMIRLFGSHGYHDVSIVSNDERMNLPECGFFRPPQCRWIAETFLSTRPLWADKTIVLLGDVFFTENAVEKIASFKEGVHVYGRPGRSLYTGCCYGEIFAVVFDQSQRDNVIKHAEIACQDAQTGGRGKLWNFYRSLAGFPLNKEIVEKNIFQKIHDFTDDIDYPSEHGALVKRYGELATAGAIKYFWIHLRVGVPAVIGAGLRKILRPIVSRCRHKQHRNSPCL